MTTRADVVVVGASIAGVRVAQSLRNVGFGGSIRLLGAEADLPYDKPPLSKAFLTGSAPQPSGVLLDAEGAREAGIDLQLGRPAVALDLAERRVVLEEGQTVGFGALVVATGASATPSPWGGGSRVHVLRSLREADRLRTALGASTRLGVVGAGVIGCEVAASARTRGIDVVMFDPEPYPMSRLASPLLAARLLDLHRANGVQCRMGVRVAELRETETGVDILLDDGTETSVDHVLVGIGAIPNVAWLGDALPLTSGGVRCDESGRVDGVPGVYAIGDVAAWKHPVTGQHRRVEHWSSAVEQAVCVARRIHGDHDSSVLSDQFVWTDQYDWKLQFAGEPSADCLSTLVEGPRGPHQVAELLSDADGNLLAAAAVNWPLAIRHARRELVTGRSTTQVLTALGATDTRPTATMEVGV